MTDWATPDDVRVLTGADVGADLVTQAQAVIEMTVGARVIATDATTIGAGQLDWLRRATAYQAAWMVAHPDYFERMDVSSFSQDGLSANLKADALIIAPNARRCLKNLARMGTRSVQVLPGGPAVPAGNWYTSDDIDDSLPWQPLA